MTSCMFADLAAAGKPLSSIKVVDPHLHNSRVSHFFSRFENGADMLASMDRIGINYGVLSDLWSVEEQWNSFDKLCDFCNLAPGRFYAYSSPHPDWGDFYTNLSRQCANPLVAGIKLHPVVHEKPFDCKQYNFACEVGAEHGIPLLFHTWGVADIDAISALADRYPKTNFLAGHSGGEAAAVAYATKMSALRDNLYLDTACSFVWQGAIEYMVRIAGARKVLYGSDAYWNSMEVAIGRVLFAEISEEEKTMILGENALRLYKRIKPADV